ncbi:hypothetical protein Gogos_003897 [Gossypium gossypioides]|uniref:NOG C-terminal domain-containing protein n=1 Tax=Gossypium gossypioides TaxID=34282 RepID=A0A7J9CNH9_GOSGO|nr:hypothetical protein [Gossypium gossypioides]
MNYYLNRFHVVLRKPHDQKKRPVCIPQAVLKAKANQVVEKIEKDLEDENGGIGVYSVSLSKNYILANNEWKEGIMTKIVDGHNLYNFIDTDILLRLEELEREEGLR